MQKTGLLMVQLGSPKSTSVEDVKSYLHDFLTDPRLIPQHDSLWWKALLNWIILPKRSPISAANYAKIQVDGEFPLVKYTREFSQELSKHCEIPLAYAFALGQGPSAKEALQSLVDQGCNHIRILPLFPQFASATSLSAKDQVLAAIQAIDPNLSYEFTPFFYNTPAFLDAEARQIQKVIDSHQVDKLLISFHSYPLSRVHDGDPYEKHCLETAQGIVSRLKNFDPANAIVCFQSKLGNAKWLEPATADTVENLAKSGVKSIAVCAPAFVVDNLETLEEIGMEAKESFLEHGGEQFHFIPCPNVEPQWCQDFAKQITLPNREIERSPIQLPTGMQLPVQAKAPTRLSPKTKQTFKLMALILFLDSAGFSMIFPLFPALLSHYIGNEGNQGLFSHALGAVHQFENWIGVASPFATIVLFGGLLSFVYGFLQFIASPMLGSISDRIGRKPVLLTCILGLALSYLIWGIAGSFTMLILSRILAGLMGSSITSASAVVADLTDSSNRAKGMAVLGISFGMGFIFGPAIGGYLSTLQLQEYLPSLAAHHSSIGLHPFSAPALAAFLFSMTAAHFLFYRFKETHDPKTHHSEMDAFSINPFKVLSTKQYPGVRLTNATQFFYLFAFAASEFSLTFLTTERLGYTAKENGLLFLFMGFLLIMVQGGYVRRKAHVLGERTLASRGAMLLVPAMFTIALAPNTWVLLLGLGLMSIGASLLNPTLNSLVSRYAPAHEQGRIQGIFRSLGSLGRCLGPLVGCIFFWRFGGAAAYVFTGLALLIPAILLMRLPAPPQENMSEDLEF